jgi:ribosome-binding ATPase YchF (GTP1/OBG family)
LDLLSKKTLDWTALDLDNFVKALRKKTKPMLIAANKADLCKDLSILDKIKERSVACSAEAELLLKKATKAGLITYMPGDSKFVINNNVKITDEQQRALDVVKTILEKLKSTGVQNILNTVVFDILKQIVVYPVEDETKLSNKNGEILPDAKLLPVSSTTKDLASSIHKDLEKGFLYAIDVKTKQRIGSDYTLKNGDVIKIVSSLSRG